MPPKEELFVPFQRMLKVRHSSSEEVLEWERVRHLVFFRPKGAPPDIVWFHHRIYLDVRDGVQNTKVMDDFACQLSYHHRHRDFLRVIPLKESSVIPTGTYLLSKINTHLVELDGAWARPVWKVIWPGQDDAASFMHSPILPLVRQVTELIHDHCEDWMRLVRWAHASSEERFWSQVSWTHGSKEEWLGLVQALLQIVLAFSNRNLFSLPIRVLKRPMHNFPLLRPCKNLFREELPPPVWELLECAEKYFQAKIDYTLLGFRRGYLYYGRPRPSDIVALKPSQHELMEGIYLWHEFGRKSGQLAQVESNLQQLLT